MFMCSTWVEHEHNPFRYPGSALWPTKDKVLLMKTPHADTSHWLRLTLTESRSLTLPQLWCNKEAQSGRLGLWGGWVTVVSLRPRSAVWLLCTCQSSCDIDSLLMGCWRPLETQARWEVPDHGPVPHQQVTPRVKTLTIRRAEESAAEERVQTDAPTKHFLSFRI